jgi:hypothetical protein
VSFVSLIARISVAHFERRVLVVVAVGAFVVMIDI